MKIVSANPHYDHHASHPATNSGSNPKLKLVHDWGFDQAARFKMLAVGNVAQFSAEGGNSSVSWKVLPLYAGAFKIVAQDTGTRLDHNKFGLVTIEGIMAGNAQLALVDSGGKTIDEITIRVVEFRPVSIRFYNLIDGRNRRGISNPESNSSVSAAALRDLVEEVNDIVALQCGVMLGMAGEGLLRDLRVSSDLGNQVNLLQQQLAIFGSTDIDRSAQYHVAFAWALDHANGVTANNITLLRNNLGPVRALSLAHEFVHFISGDGLLNKGHDEPRDDRSNLMHDGAPHAI